MATKVLLKNPQTGVTKNGFYGFSWTTLFFGGFPALFRGDFLMGLVFIVLSILTGGISSIILAFMYNKRYTTGLLEQGYQFADNDAANAAAKLKLGVA